MSAPGWLCLVVLLCICDESWSWYEGRYRRDRHGHIRQMVSYPRDWDIDWAETQRRMHQTPRDLGPSDHQYQADSGSSTPVLRPRLVMLPESKVDTRGVWHSYQRGSAVIPYPGATVRVSPNKDEARKFYRGVVTSTISDGVEQKRKGQKKHRKKNKGPRRMEHWEYSKDEPAHPKVCARCPSDRAVLATKGSTTVVMEVPPIIPCHPWSSVHKVKQEIVVGPMPGSEVPEGSHKIVIRLYHRRRTIATCITRYNVIVRKCPELEVGLGVKVDCPLGEAWGAHCNISCDPGYDLEGDSLTECTDDLEWSGQESQCIPTLACPVPVTPEYGHLSCRTPQHQPVKAKGMLPDGSVCHYLCEPGYMVPPAQQNLTKVRCVAGSWDSDQDPTCVETNDLEEDDPPSEITAAEALRFDGTGCPEDYCKNNGRCIAILGQPMCSCVPGYSGPNCEDEEVDPETEIPNTIT